MDPENRMRAGTRPIPHIAALLAATTLFAVGCGAPGMDRAPAASPQKTPAAINTARLATASAIATPGVTLANADKLKELLAAAKGKAVVINVWATYCVPCMEELPELARFYSSCDPDHVAFISLDADPAYSLEDVVKPFVAEKRLPFPVYMLDGIPPDELNVALGVESTKWGGELPATFVLDPAGKLKKYWIERVHQSDLSAAVADAVQG